MKYTLLTIALAASLAACGDPGGPGNGNRADAAPYDAPAVAADASARFADEAAQQRPIEVKVGEDVFFQLPRQPQILGTEHPDIATLTVLPDGRARIHGVSVGATRIIGRDFGDLPMIFPIVVTAR